MLTKTDFLLYLDAPMHLWARVNQRMAVQEPTPHHKYLIAQGRQVEELASAYLANLFEACYSRPEVMSQKTLTDGPFDARPDVVVFDRDAGACDIYEVKSSTSVSKTHRYDLAFQYLVAGASLVVRDIYLVHLNKEYRLTGDLDLDGLFVVENLTSGVADLLDEVRAARHEAWQAANQPDHSLVPTCQAPKTCPCPQLCHPDLPEHSIYELSRLGKVKAAEWTAQGVRSIHDLPVGASLSERQRRQVQAVQTGEPFIHPSGIRETLDSMRCPLFFLDYETCNPGVPMYEGYRPYQHIVFQYSLQVVSGPEDEPLQSQFLGTGPGDPSPALLAHLGERIGGSGSVVVWNKGFEANRNREMAQRYPAYRELLKGVNQRMFDLMQVFSAGDYLHPDFHGSYSLKAVLPVMVPGYERAYDELPISQGDEAMLAWLSLVSGELSPAERGAQREALLRYCALDSRGMVAIWKALRRVLG
jgi:hypothetical protein